MAETATPHPDHPDHATARLTAFVAAWNAKTGADDETPILSAQRAARDWSHLTLGDLRSLLAENATLRRQLDAAEAAVATVWWLEGDNEYAEPDVYATAQLAHAAASREFRTANFPEFQDAIHEWVAEEHGEGLELVVAGERTQLIVRQLTVRTTVGPLESAVTEALADLAVAPADLEPAPIRPPWLIEAGDD